MSAPQVFEDDVKRVRRGGFPVGDIALILALTVVGTALWLESADYPASSRIYPRIALVIIGLGVLLTLVKVIDDLVRAPRDAVSAPVSETGEEIGETEELQSEETGSWGDALLVSGIFGIYLLVAFNLDFYISTCLFISTMTFIMSAGRDVKVILRALAFGIGSTILIHFIFVFILGVQLPSIIM